MSGEVWYPVGPRDMFPEEFATFLLTDPRNRVAFVAPHADLLDARWWQHAQAAIRASGSGRGAFVRRRRLRFAPPGDGVRGLTAVPMRRTVCACDDHARCYPAFATVPHAVNHA